MTKHVLLALAMAFLLLLAAAPLAAQLQVLAADEEPEEDDDDFGNQSCNCYHDYDCGEYQGCDIGSPMCLIYGKLDGLCGDWQSPSGIGTSEPDDDRGAESLLAAVDRYFDLYATIIADGGAGKPSEDKAKWFGELTGQPAVVDTLPAIDGCPDCPCVIVVRIYLIRVLNNAMERAFGYDFNIGPLQQFGNLRHVPDLEAAAALLGATRTAFKTAIRKRDPKAVRGPLERFWKRHPSYHPRHSGRCYPHGHKNDRPPLECQTIAFSRMAGGMLASLRATKPAD